jgi:hypothetical protein
VECFVTAIAIFATARAQSATWLQGRLFDEMTRIVFPNGRDGRVDPARVTSISTTSALTPYTRRAACSAFHLPA